MKHTPPTLSAQFAALRTSVPSGPVEGYWVLNSAIALICAALTIAPPSNAGTVTSGGRTIVLVEDEDAVRRLAQRALERNGLRVLSADCGEVALELVGRDNDIACIVTDMVMPGMDGATLIQALRLKLSRPSLPAIIVSGYAKVPLHDAIGAAATAFLPKPYAMKELVAQVAALAPDRESVRTD